jgi:hypothetical protein
MEHAKGCENNEAEGRRRFVGFVEYRFVAGVGHSLHHPTSRALQNYLPIDCQMA